MVRRSFRRGLRLGLLIGVAVAVVKLLKSYRAAEEPPAHAPAPSPWPPPRPAPTPAATKTETLEETVIEETVVETPAAIPDEGPGGEIAEPGRRQRPLRAPEPSTRPPAKKPAAKKKAAPARIWVEPSGTICPPSHPIKAKLSSRLFHLPGMLAYDRCKPDRCYADEAAAVADGLQKAKR